MLSLLSRSLTGLSLPFHTPPETLFFFLFMAHVEQTEEEEEVGGGRLEVFLSASRGESGERVESESVRPSAVSLSMLFSLSVFDGRQEKEEDNPDRPNPLFLSSVLSLIRLWLRGRVSYLPENI